MDEFMFDDEVETEGSEIEAHCPKCKSDTTHVIISKYEEEIRRVQCNPCGDVHAFRRPRGEEEEVEAGGSKKKTKAKPTWDQVMAKQKKQPRAYSIGEYFKENEVLSHPKFGNGFVTENIGDDKIEVTFQNDKRVLVHNRKGLNLPFNALRPFQVPSGGGKRGKKGAPQKAPKAAARPAAKKPAAKPKPAKPAKPVKTAAKKPAKKAAPRAKAAAKRTVNKKKPAAKKPAKKAAKKR